MVKEERCKKDETNLSKVTLCLDTKYKLDRVANNNIHKILKKSGFSILKQLAKIKVCKYGL